MNMTAKDMSDYHRTQARLFHERAQVARRDKLEMKSKGRFLEALKAEIRWKEYIRSRDDHKAKARSYK